MADPLRVAVLGLGTMGAGMARSLGRQGHRLALWNRTRARADEVARTSPVRGSPPRPPRSSARPTSPSPCSPIRPRSSRSSRAPRESWRGSGGTLEAWNEGIALAAKGGIDPALMYETFLGGRAKSGIMEMKAPQVLKRDFAPFFQLRLMEKDVDLALDAAHALKVPMPALAATKQVLAACMAYGLGDEDFSTTIKFFERAIGSEIKPRTT